MALGLNTVFLSLTTMSARDIIKKKSLQFMDRFKAKFGSVYCRDLLGADVGTDEARQGG